MTILIYFRVFLKMKLLYLMNNRLLAAGKPPLAGRLDQKPKDPADTELETTGEDDSPQSV